MNFIEGHDTFVSLPTGYGKSICYAILPSIFDRMCHRISCNQALPFACTTTGSIGSDVTATLNQLPVQEIPGPVETKPLWVFDQTLSPA